MKKITRDCLEKFLKSHATTQKVLEIGGGAISRNYNYHDLFPNYTTVDIDPTREPDIVGDVHCLPFSDYSYEVVLCTEVLEHCHDPQRAIDEMYRVLKPGGKLILTTRFCYPLHDVPGDYFRFTIYGLRHLFKEWNILELTPETDVFSAMGVLFQRIGFQTQMRGGKITKSFVYALATVMNNLNWLIIKQYGDIKRSTEVPNVLTTGYYIVAEKTK